MPVGLVARVRGGASNATRSAFMDAARSSSYRRRILLVARRVALRQAGQMTWTGILATMAAWQRDQFPKATTRSALDHLRREIDELLANPDDIEEWADAFHLVVQGGTKAAGSLDNFQKSVSNKLNHNITERKWPAEPDANNVYEHVKPTEFHNQRIDGR